MNGPKFSSVSGAATTTPATPASALSTAEQAQWESLVARFGAPATKAAPLARSGGSVPLIGFQVGLLVGQGGARLAGFTDDQVCAERNGALTFAASVLDGVNCNAFESAIAEAQRNLDQSPDMDFDPVAVGGVRVEHLASIVDRPLDHPYPLLSCYNVDLAAVPDMYNVSIEDYSGPDNVRLSGWMDSSYCPKALHANASSGYSAIPLLRWRVALWSMYPADYPPIYSDWQSPKSVTYPNPQRSTRCSIYTTDGHVYSADSEPYSESDALIAPPKCPTLPPGKVASKQEFTYLVNENPTDYSDSKSTEAYVAWAQAHPECANGSCPTELFKDGVSCFRTADPDDCDGWADASDRDSVYTCKVGTSTVPISDCFIYGQLFNTANRANGHAYADPATGGPVAGQTSPTRTDRLTEKLLKGGKSWLSWDAPSTKLGEYQTDSSRDDTVRAVAEQCVALAASDDECKSLPIFAPGKDIAQATANDIAGLAKNPAWMRLNYADDVDRARKGWYSDIPPCDESARDPNLVQDCDEYPYISTRQGGPGAQIKLISPADNQLEGRYLGFFYSSGGCGVESPTYANLERAFLVIPTPTAHTSIWCNATTE